MKKIAFYLFWTFMCLHTSVSFSDAANSDITDALAEIDAIIAESETSTGVETSTQTESELELDAAPTQYVYPTSTQIAYTPWELIHRTAMLQGFTWSGTTANFVTPAMYVGTPIQTNMSELGYDVALGATNYSECVRMETDASFGVDGEIMEETVEDELRGIAKYCATEYLGSYFSGKNYTTREEMLMFLFTMFDEGVYLPGYFEDTEFVFDGEETETAYSNVSSEAWFAPYLWLAYDLMMVEDEGTWKIAREVTDKDIETMLEMYLMDEEGEVVDTIETAYGTYTIWYDEIGLALEKDTQGGTLMLTSAPEETEISEDITTEGSVSDEDILAELFAE
jgi:hypothetical protein